MVAVSQRASRAAPGVLEPFDVELFVASKLEDAFGDIADQVGVVALVPLEADQEFDRFLGEAELPELEGYSQIPADGVRAAADQFATRNGMRSLEGRWVAYGLVPQYPDSPTAEWESRLSGVTSTIAQVDFEVRTTRIPEGWDVVADLPFGVVDGALVEAVDGGVVVVQPDATQLIELDGSWRTGDAPPLEVPSYCCGGVLVMPTGRTIVLLDESSAATWILDVDDLTWQELDPRPSSGYVLGSVLVDDELVTLNARRASEDEGNVVTALDLAEGTWRQLEPVPSSITAAGTTNDDDRLIVAGTLQGPNNNVIGDRNPVVYEYEPGQGWQELPEVPIDGQASTVVWVEGAGLLAWNYDMESALLDETGSWQALDRVPMAEGECYPGSIQAPTGIVGLFCGQVAWFDTATQSWKPIPSLVPTKVVATQNAVVGIINTDREESGLVEYPLPPGE